MGLLNTDPDRDILELEQAARGACTFVLSAVKAGLIFTRAHDLAAWRDE